MKEFEITTEFIKLDQFLKFAEVVSSGGEAKELISQGEVKVNGEVDTRRGKKLRSGDEIEVSGESYRIKQETIGVHRKYLSIVFQKF